MWTCRHRPPAILGDYIRFFSERTAELGNRSLSLPLPARVDQLIEFYLEDRYLISRNGRPAGPAPELAIVGPQGRPGTWLHLSGSLKVFTIHFQPGGLNALFGIAISELTDQGVAAQSLIGRSADHLRYDLMRAEDFAERVGAAQRWLVGRMSSAKPVDIVARIARAVIGSGGLPPVRELARQTGLSDRQFSRRFEHQTGLTPKVFARAVRFGAALEAKSEAPERSWTDIAYEAGYADQSHLIRDSRQLGGAPPRRFYADWSAVP